MNRELQDYVWACLPKEFKEEVKYKYNKTKTKKIKKECDLGFLNAHEGMFGAHNLTSDAEGEDNLLCVGRKQIDALQGEIFEAIMDAHDADDWQDAAHYILDVMPRSFATLFGSKCLPDGAKDEAKKSFEPKFKAGDKVRIVDDSRHGQKYRGDVTRIIYVDESDCTYMVDIYDEECGSGLWYSESDLEPYTEPTANYMHSERDLNTAVLTDKCSSASTCDKQFDNIIKDGSREHNRLHIAAQIVADLYANNQAAKDFKSIEELVHKALDISDTLIKESEKGGVE